jgi:tetratricopeptide (TPR) repeat protein
VTILRNPECVSLLVNGKADASIPSGLNPESNLSALDALHDLPTQVLFGQIPLLLAPKRDDVLVVGLGSGVTVGSVLQHPVREVECVELEDAVVKGSQFFDQGNLRPLADPRLKLIVNDARNHLLVTEKKYDIIISEPSNPWIPGAASLFTKEFFETSQKRLAPEGVFCQWIQLYQLQEEHFKTILQTFTAVFPHVHVFRIKHDTVLLGSQHAIEFDLPEIGRRMTPKVRDDLARVRVHGVEDLLAWYWIGEKELATQLKGNARNTDDNMLIEFAAPLQVLASHTAGNGPRLADLFGTSTGVLPQLRLPSETEPAGFWARVAKAALEIKALNLATNYAGASWGMHPNPLAASVLAEEALLRDRNSLAAEILSNSGFPNSPEILRSSAMLYSLEGKWKVAGAAGEKLVAQNPGEPIGLFCLGRSLFYLGDHKRSAAVLRQIPVAAAGLDALREAPFFLGALALEEKRYDEASRQFLRFLKYEPAHTETRTLLADAFYHSGLVSEAAEQWQMIARLNSSKANRLVEQAIQNSRMGRETEAAQALGQAARLDSGNANIVLMLARQKQNQKDSEGAIALLKKYLELHPNRPDAVGYLSQFLAEQNKRDEAGLEAARYRALTGHEWVEVR